MEAKPNIFKGHSVRPNKVKDSPPQSVWLDGSPDTDGWPFPGVTASLLVFHPALTSFPVNTTGKKNSRLRDDYSAGVR